MNDGHDDLKGAGISPRERLERIEAMLEKIDGKLDNKTDQVDFLALQARVYAAEEAITAVKLRVAAAAGLVSAVVFGANFAVAKGWF